MQQQQQQRDDSAGERESSVFTHDYLRHCCAGCTALADARTLADASA